MSPPPPSAPLPPESSGAPARPAPSGADGAPHDLVAECLDRMEREGPAALEELCRTHPAQAARLRGRIARLGALGLAGPSGDAVPERVGAFRLLARLGGGGMGVVYAAEQEGLQRPVALKLIRPGSLDLAGARERFRREVDVLSRLSHPGIVQVYAGGEDGGVPYLAMELVRGATLEEALSELPCARHETPDHADRPAPDHAAEVARLTGRDLLAAVRKVMARRTAGLPPATVARTPLPADSRPVAPPAEAGRTAGGSAATELPRLYAGNWVMTCVRLARHVAEALEHAHGQTVLHRDIKPSNVMLTPDGRVLLLDFGLAAAADSVRLTGSGQPLGSPAYMSPEQLRGDRGAAHARADVYGLGLTLYEALTLHQPFAGSSVAQTTRRVLAGEPPAARTRNAAVPRDVETVVQAAIERDPARRYASVAAFAADLDAVLELRPVSVRRPGPWRVARRWAQRRPATAAAGVLIAVLALAGPLGWELSRQRSLDTVTSALDQSERHFQAALSAIRHVLRETATEDLEDVPRMQRAQLAALDRALELFGTLERERPDDALVLEDGAQLHLSRADVLRDLGHHEMSVPAYTEGIGRLRRLLDARPDSRRRVLLASALNRAAKAQFGVGQSARAQELYGECLALLRQACAEAPERLDWTLNLAAVLANLAEARRGLAPDADMRATLEESLALASAVRAARPQDVDAVWTEARVCAELADIFGQPGTHEVAREWAGRALAGYERARDLSPGSRFHAFDVSTGHLAVAIACTGLSRLDEATEAARAGLAIVDELLADYPDVRRYGDRRTALLDSLAIVQGLSGEHAIAATAFEARVAELDELCRLSPERADLQAARLEAQSNLISALLDGRERYDDILALLDLCDERLAALTALGDPPAVVPFLQRIMPYNRARLACFRDRKDLVPDAIAAFEAVAGRDAFGCRYAADLWNEYVLSLRRSGAAGAPVDEATAIARMYELLHLALDAGYADRAELDATPSLDTFRDDAAFRALLDRLPVQP